MADRNDGTPPRTALLDLPNALIECIARALRLLELGRFARSSVVCRAAAESARPEVVAIEVARRLTADKWISMNALCAACPHLIAQHGPAKVGPQAFWNCTSLMSITLPSSVTSISSDAFIRCTSLTTVTLPATLTRIGNWAFCACRSPAAITLPASLKKIGIGAFFNFRDSSAGRAQGHP